MFLGMGGSRRRAAHAQQQQGNAQLQGSLGTGLLKQELSHQGLVREDPLQALATGKYAPLRTSMPFCEEDDLSSFVTAGCCNSSSRDELPVQLSLPCSPKSTLLCYVPNVPSLSKDVSSGDSGVSLPGGEDAMSRDCTLFEPTRRSQALDLAKKLRSSLGSKFADSLRETIKEVAMKHDTSAWLQAPLAQRLSENNAIATTTTTVVEPVSQSHVWTNNEVVSHSGLLPFEGLAALDASGSESSVKQRRLGAEHSKRLSWFSQENLPQSAMAELSWGRSAQGGSTLDTEFFTSGHPDMSLRAALKEPAAKESWTDCSTMSRLRSALTRRYVFPDSAAADTRTPDSEQSSPNFRESKPSLNKKGHGVEDLPSFLDLSKGFVGKDGDFLQELLNPRLYTKVKGSGGSWHEEASTCCYDAAVLELPEVGIEPCKGVKRPRADDAYSLQSAKRECLLDAPVLDDDGVEGKADAAVVIGGFDEYLADLAATVTVPSFELPGSPLSNLLKDFSQDSIVPIHLP